jgi:hypothetical protein
LFSKTDKINTKKQKCFIQREDEEKGISQAKLEMQSTFSLLTLNNIIYNPKATINILSFSKLDEAKCKTTIDRSEILITLDDKKQKIYQESIF